jgi:hypothetical protein
MTTPWHERPVSPARPDADERPIDETWDSDNEPVTPVSEATMEADPTDATEQRMIVPINEEDSTGP